MNFCWLFLILFGVLLSSCGGGGAGINTNMNGVSVTKMAHGDSNDNNFYISNTDNIYYLAYKVSNLSNKNISLQVALINQNNNFALVTDSNLYPQLSCLNISSLNQGQSCEVLITIANRNNIQNLPSYSVLQVIANKAIYHKLLTINNYAYIVGNFSQVYANNSNDLPIIKSIVGGSCGVNNDNACQMLKLDLFNNKLTSLLITDSALLNITIDNYGMIYTTGSINYATYGTKTIYSPTTINNTSVSAMLLNINPAVNGNMNDVLASNGFKVDEYPNGVIYALNYYNHNLYLAGNFTQIANINTDNYTYPIIKYDINRNTNASWSNALGDNENNADAGISSIGFDTLGNMYISGFYTTINKIQYIKLLPPYNQFPINVCNLDNNSSYFTCDASNYAVLNGYSVFTSPASALNFNNNTLLSGGGFSSINNAVGPSDNIMLGAININNKLDSANWVSLINYGFPDNIINAVDYYDNNKLLIGGNFSTIGNLVADNNIGTCGTDGDNGCLFALFNGTSWQKLFITDSQINDTILTREITGT